VTAAESAVPPNLKIPDAGELSLKNAAQAYAKAGLYVLPVASGKHPGSIVGKRWPEKSSTDADQIERWWTEHPHAGIAIHTGPSGMTFFDLDTDTVPHELAWLKSGIVQFSRAASVGSERGHYGFFTGHEIFTSGDLKLADGSKVGEIRSGNTVVIASPSPHIYAETKSAEYRWRADDVSALVPVLPSSARQFLRPIGTKNGDGNQPATAGVVVEATDFAVKAATRDWRGNAQPKKLGALVTWISTADAATRNQTRDALRIAACEARIGLYPLADAIDNLRAAMIASYRARGEIDKFDDGEFLRLVKNGVGYALSRSPREITMESTRDYGAHHDGDFEDEVERERRKLEVRAEAKRRFDGSAQEPFRRTPMSLQQLLAQPPNPTPMRIDQVMPDGGRVIFSAPYKAGKTTAVGNLIRSLVDGDPFLNAFTVNKTARRLVLIDNEMSQDMVRDLLLKQQIKNTDAVADVICLRGEVGSFDILSDGRRREWAAHLRDIGCDYLIFDCLRPALDALGLDENHDAGRFLDAFDELLLEAGIDGNATVIHHMGHTSERARGDSRIQDWADAIWKIVRQKPSDDLSSRLFSATGRRDVALPEGVLEYDAASRHLTYRDVNRTQAQKQQTDLATFAEVSRLLTENQINGGNGMSGNQIEIEAVKKPGVTKRSVRAVLKHGAETGQLAEYDGARNARMYTLAAVSPSDD